MNGIKPYKDKDGKYKVGVAMSLCMYCGEPSGVVMGGKDIDEIGYKGAVFSSEPCDECKELMKQGIMICEVQDGQQNEPNPYRTGRLIVIKEESFKSIFNMSEKTKSGRFFYMEETLFEKLFGKYLKEEETKNEK
jgi:hypothetical protein